MSTPAIAPQRAGAGPRRGRGAGFGEALHAEWTKFRTVRGWVIGMVIAALATPGIALLDHSSCGGQLVPGGPVITGAGCAVPAGPGGEAVTDSFYFVHQPLTGDGSITARMTALASPSGGLQPWAKAGIIIKAGTRPGSAYAAMLATGRHGIRFQYDYTGDVAAPAGPVSARSPRWLRLTRHGDTLAGYESADGRHWTTAGTAHLAGLPGTVQAGLFAASPGTSHTISQSVTGSSAGGALTLATGRFDHVSLRGQRPGGSWVGSMVGGGPGNGGPAGEGFRRAGGTITVTGTGDIAPQVPGAGGADGTPVEQTLQGMFAALIAALVVAALFMTAEYRRGLIRVTLAARPRRGQVLAAKAVVIGAVSFAAGLAGSAVAMALGVRLLRSNGIFILPVGMLTEVRVVAGTAAVLALAAVLAVALGAILRHGAAAVTAVIAGIVLPYFFSAALPMLLPAGVEEWLLRVTPAAGFAIQGTLVRYPQVTAAYTPANGYYPLAPWAGFAVLCGYAAVAVGLAAALLRRRDA